MESFELLEQRCGFLKYEPLENAPNERTIISFPSPFNILPIITRATLETSLAYPNYTFLQA